MNAYVLAVGLLFPPVHPVSADAAGCAPPLTADAVIAEVAQRVAPAGFPLRIHRPGWPAYAREYRPSPKASPYRMVSQDGTVWVRGPDGRWWILRK